MKVTCRYCESYVEVDETAVCPCCSAPLGEAVDVAKEQAAADAEKQAEQEAEVAALHLPPMADLCQVAPLSMSMASGKSPDLKIEGQVAVKIINDKTSRAQHVSSK